MSTVFRATGPSMVLAYADDSTNSTISITGAEATVVNALMVVNVDTANVIAVATGTDEFDTAAIVPTSGDNGSGTVIGPGATQIIRVGETFANTLYIAVSGVSGTGNVYLTPGQAE